MTVHVEDKLYSTATFNFTGYVTLAFNDSVASIYRGPPSLDADLAWDRLIKGEYLYPLSTTCRTVTTDITRLSRPFLPRCGISPYNRRTVELNTTYQGSWRRLHCEHSSIPSASLSSRLPICHTYPVSIANSVLENSMAVYILRPL